MNFEEKSDLELNAMVAKIEYQEIESAEFIECNDGLSVKVISDGIAMEIVDYCNNPSDYMPIVLRCGLMIVSDDTFECHIDGESLWKAHNRKGFHWHDIKYGRAAMIAFINLHE